MTTDATMSHGDVTDLIPDYVLGALSANAASMIDDHLATCVSCAADVDAASVIHRIAAAGVEQARPSLRSNVLAAAFAARPVLADREHERSPEFGAWEAEIGRFRALLDHPLLGHRQDLESSAWNSLCVEKFDLSIRSMVCHLIAAESLRAMQLGDPIDAIPETSRHLERRTRAVIDRHSALSVTKTINEFDRVIAVVGSHLRSLDAEQRCQDSVMAPGFTIDENTALRALETWTHADDIRLALGEGEMSPEAVHTSTMSAVLPRWISFVLSSASASLQDRHYRIELTGPGGQTLDILPPGPSAGPDMTVTCDAVEFCKLAGARRNPDTFGYEATGSRSDSQAFVHAIAEFEMI